jgi:hypothetical protein
MKLLPFGFGDIADITDIKRDEKPPRSAAPGYLRARLGPDQIAYAAPADSPGDAHDIEGQHFHEREHKLRQSKQKRTLPPSQFRITGQLLPGKIEHKCPALDKPPV